MTHDGIANTTDEIEELFEENEEAALAAIKQKSVSGAVSYMIRTLILNAIGLVTAAILSGYLSPSDFGVYGYVTQFVGLFVFFSDIGLAAALVQKKEEPSETDYRTAFTIQQILSWLIFIAFLVLSFTGIVQQKTGPVGTGLLLVLGLSFPLASLKTIPSLKLERQLNFNKLVLPQIFEQLVYNGVLIFFALSHVGVQSYTYAILARSLIGVVVIYFIKPWLPGLSLNKISIKGLLGFGLKFQLNDFLARIKDSLFYLALGTYFPLNQFGYIQWAKTWSTYPYNLTVQNVMAITFPTFSRLQKHREALGKAIEKSVFFVTFLIFPILIGMCVFAIPVTHVIVKYQKWQPAVLALILFTSEIAWSSISNILTNTLNAIGKIDVTLKLMVMWTVLTWVVTPIMIYFYGYNGVAAAAFIISFTSLIPLWEVKKTVTVHIWENVWRQIVAAVAMSAVGLIFLPLWSKDLFFLLVGCAVASLTYFGVFGAVGYKKLFVELKSLRKK